MMSIEEFTRTVISTLGGMEAVSSARNEAITNMSRVEFRERLGTLMGGEVTIVLTFDERRTPCTTTRRTAEFI